MTPVYNASYSPELNPIEAVFSVVKNTVKRHKLNRQLNGNPVDMHKLVLAAMQQITPALVQSCIGRSDRLR